LVTWYGINAIMDDFEIKQINDFVRAMEIILRHEDIEHLKELEEYCQHRIKQLEVENETQAFM
jgi:mevalonate kinase